MRFIFFLTLILASMSCAGTEYKARHALYSSCCVKQNGEFCTKTYEKLIGSGVYASYAVSQCCASGICKYK